MDYPKKFDVCPHCGSMNRIIEQESKQELAKGNIRIAEKVGVLTLQTTIFDPGKTGLIAPKKFPVIVSRMDVCADCGAVYCVEVDKIEGTATPQIRRNDHSPKFPFTGQG